MQAQRFEVDRSKMQWLDRYIQLWRIQRAEKYIQQGDRLLDIGCFDGVLLQRNRSKLTRAVGLDPLVVPFQDDEYEVYQSFFPGDAQFEDEAFDCITMLAVLEHIHEKDVIARECFRVLAPGGRVVLTVPHPRVDTILDILTTLHILGGMSEEEHHEFDVTTTPSIFEAAGFRTLRTEVFQLGLNFLYAFEKPKA